MDAHPELNNLSTVERAVKDVDPPKLEYPTDDQLFRNSDQSLPDCDFLCAHFYREGMLSEEQILRIISKGTDILREEASLLVLPAPIIICGDIHGQYYDLLKLFEVGGGAPPTNRYLFLGDYVDRGYFSIECFVYLLALKIAYPERIYLLRGNHECRHLTKHFTFKLECKYKYSEEVYEKCMLAFDALALAAVVNKQFFCTHGGLSPDLVKASDVLAEPPKSGLMCDLLWSDPSTNYGEERRESFGMNTARGCSYRFSYSDACKFLDANRLLSVIRGHEAQNEGYRLYKAHPKSDFPSLITLFSAPNYVDVYNNKGAILHYDGQVFNIRQFGCSPHPYYLPKFMDAFDWSLPFVGQNVTDLLLAILNIPSMKSKLSELTAAERDSLEQAKADRQDAILSKVRTVGRVGKMFATIRSERETLTELVNAVGTEVAPSTELSIGQEEIRQAIGTFEEARVCDRINEMDPEEAGQDEDDAASVVSGGSFAEESFAVKDECLTALLEEVAGAEVAKEAKESGESPIDMLVHALVEESSSPVAPQPS